MKLIELAFKKFSKCKRLKLYIFSMALTFGLAISVIYSMYLLNEILGEKIKNNIINRVIIASGKEDFTKDDLKELEDLDNIECAYNRLVMIQTNIEENNMLLVYVTKDEVPEVIEGKKIENSNELQLLIPSKIYNRDGKEVKLNKYIGKVVNLKFGTLELEVKVTGIYNSKHGGGYAYINEALRKKLIDYNEVYEDKSCAYIVIDSYKNVDDVINHLKEKYKYSSNIYNTSGQMDIKIYNMATILIFSILALTVLFIYISTSIIIEGIISDEKMDIAILKAIGYRIKDIYTIMKYRILAIAAISLIISSIISMILIYVISFVIKYKLDITLINNLNTFAFIYIFFVVCVYIISVLSVKLNNRKIKKVNTIELLKEN